MLQSMGLQRVGHDLVTEQQQISVKGFPKIKHCRLGSIKNCFVPTEGSFFFSAIHIFQHITCFLPVQKHNMEHNGLTLLS